MRFISIALIAALTLGGCAGRNMVAGYEPVIDTRGVDPAAYGRDLQDCRYFAAMNDPAARAASGALAGAVIGAILGAAIGGGRGAGFGAGVGAASGGTQGAVSGIIGQQLIVKRCMAGRGYRVLD